MLAGVAIGVLAGIAIGVLAGVAIGVVVGAALGAATASLRISSRESGPRRYESAQRDWKRRGLRSCTE
jgi:hypothetical protein